MRLLVRKTRVSDRRLTILLTFLGFVLQCALVSADTWDIQTLDSEGDVGHYTSLALDGLGFPHISYYDVTNENLKYAYRDANGWHIQTVDFLGNVGYYTSLALDSAGFPHIAYSGNADAKYAYQDSSGWHVHFIETGGWGWGASLVLDPSDFPHISQDGFYSYQDSSGWIHESVPDVYNPEIGNDLALDAAGGPHLTFVSYEPYDWLMRYASKRGGSWQTEVVDDEPTAGAGCSLLMDASRVLHVSYVTPGLYWNVKYARRDESGWLTQIVDQIDSGYDRWWTSLVLDSEGFPHFSYWREGNLVIQHWDGLWWYLETVDSDGDVGYFSSMALAASDRPHISYYDVTNGNVKYARLLPSEIALTGELEAGQLCLTWEPVAGVSGYWVFGVAREPWFLPDLSPPTYVNRVAVVPGGTTTWSSANGIAEPDNNWTYLVIAVDETEAELARSNRVGEHDFATDIP